MHNGLLYRFSGGIELYIGMTDKIQENATQETVFNKFILIDEKTTEVLNSSASSHEIALKAQLDSQKPNFNPPNIAIAIKTFLENEFDCGARTIMKSSLIIILRFSNLSSLQMFQERYYLGTVTQKLEKYLLKQFSTTNGTLPKIEFEFDVQEEALRHYRDVHLTFQGKICDSYNMVCPPVRVDYHLPLGCGLSPVEADKPWYNNFIPASPV